VVAGFLCFAAVLSGPILLWHVWKVTGFPYHSLKIFSSDTLFRLVFIWKLHEKASFYWRS